MFEGAEEAGGAKGGERAEVSDGNGGLKDSEGLKKLAREWAFDRLRS